MRRFQTRWIAWVLAAVACAVFTMASSAQQRARQSQKGTRIHGHIVRVQGPNQFVVRTADKREVILHTNDQTRFLLNNRAVRFADLRDGAEINAVFDVVEDRNLTNSVIITSSGAVEQVPVDVTEVEGTIVEVKEPDRLVVRTSRGEEVILVTDVRTTFALNDRAVRLADFRPGMAIRAKFDVKNRKNVVRSVVNMPKRPR
jgi:hypothetical protein